MGDRRINRRIKRRNRRPECMISNNLSRMWRGVEEEEEKQTQD